MWIGMAHDNPHLTPPDRLRFDCCIMLTRDVAPAGEIGTRTIGGDLYATTTHYGSFDRLAETYGWLGGNFMPSAGLIPRRAPAIEIYLNNPETTPPEQLLTDILLPVESTKTAKGG
jgi:AraC family transcriptional regulator